MNFKPCCLPTAIGSFPYSEPGPAIELVMRHFPKIPLWPQLPSAGQKEQMYIQFYEGIPGITYDTEKKKLTAGIQDETFFEKAARTLTLAIEDRYAEFVMSVENARGFYYFLENFNGLKKEKPVMIKGQITGPVSFSLVVTDENLKPVLYDESYRELICAVLGMKAAWQINEMKKICRDVLMFVDEPYMSSFGSSMIALSKDVATDMIKKVIKKIHENGAASGLHCCGNTDWSILLCSGCGVISFDAYGYGENFLLYPGEIIKFINSGGIIAWGIVPTSEDVYKENMDTLKNKLIFLVKKLASFGIDESLILRQSLITPSCGLGDVDVGRAETVLELTAKLSDNLRSGEWMKDNGFRYSDFDIYNPVGKSL